MNAIDAARHAPVRRHRLTVEDYHRMGEAGTFAPGERVELIDGEIIDRPPIGSSHGGTVNRLNHLLVTAVGERAIVSVQNSIVLGDHSEPEPDVALLRPREDFYRSATARAEDVLLVIEVAVTTLAYDRDVKLSLYARHGIPEVWLIDVEGGRLTAHRDPSDGRYATLETPADLRDLRPRELDGVGLDLSDLF